MAGYGAGTYGTGTYADLSPYVAAPENIVISADIFSRTQVRADVTAQAVRLTVTAGPKIQVSGSVVAVA